MAASASGWDEDPSEVRFDDLVNRIEKPRQEDQSGTVRFDAFEIEAIESVLEHAWSVFSSLPAPNRDSV